ncbi:hypothetical protein D9619_004499 [Psilocybe cf. subviscida]|uniref:N-acetyltransferase domain-containing protein n=1 Tax=Psilocybe cf. subviscida TaxID=2480587 RepID=A0A8H5F7S3_9AGAR|nr:hypothetical protein D9619_004499 [Psilocybe cf. subviscida]
MAAFSISNDTLEKGEGNHALDAKFTDSQINARPMGLKDVWGGAKTWINAFKDDPTAEYLRADKAPFAEKWYGRYVYCACLALWCRGKVVFTVDGAVSWSSGDAPEPKTPFNARREQLAIYILKRAAGKLTPEQEQRSKERGIKHRAALAEAFPSDRRENMYYLQGLVTDPAQQGRGLGSAVLRAFTACADKSRRGCWLISTNANNSGFYNSHGFKTAASYLLGDQNPNWKKKPVLVEIMIRQPEDETRADKNPTEIHLNTSEKE